MSTKKFKQGSQLFALARKKAGTLGIPYEKTEKMADLIHRVQAGEGHQSCFKQLEVCSELDCCWQASCSAVMDRT